MAFHAIPILYHARFKNLLLRMSRCKSDKKTLKIEKQVGCYYGLIVIFVAAFTTIYY